MPPGASGAGMRRRHGSPGHCRQDAWDKRSRGGREGTHTQARGQGRSVTALTVATACCQLEPVSGQKSVAGRLSEDQQPASVRGGLRFCRFAGRLLCEETRRVLTREGTAGVTRHSSETDGTHRRVSIQADAVVKGPCP